MRRGSHVAFLILLPIWTTAAFVACGGDDNGGNGGADAATSDGSSSDAFSGGDTGGSDSSTAPEAKANDVDVYVTQSAQLDASSSTPSGATFSWQLASAPAGSAVTTATIVNATSAAASLPTDAIGTYVLTLKVTSGGQSATKNVNVRAFSGKVFLSHIATVDAGNQNDVLYAPTTGGDGGAATVSCETTYVPSFTNGTGTITSAFASTSLPGALDWQEGAPADEAKVAFGFREVVPDGGFSNYLATGTSSSSCNTIKKLDAFVNTGDVPQAVRISPNGDRVAFVRQNGSTIDVATIGMDGSNLHVLGSLFSTSDGGVGASPAVSFFKRRLQWTDETHVAWVSDSTDVAGAFSVLIATDTAAPTVGDYMDCTTAVSSGASSGQADINEFSILPSGVVLVSGSVTEVDAGASGIYALRPNASTKQCELLGQIGSAGSVFALSPDVSRIAFTMPDPDAGIFAIYLAPLDGGALSEVRSNDAGIAAGLDFGPQWVQGGTALAFSNNVAVVDGGSGVNAFVVPVSGGQVSPVAFSGSSSEQFIVPTSSAACSIGAVGSATPAAGLFLSLGLFMVRRRNKKKRSDS